MAATLDTLQIVKRLKEAGFGDSQAEAVTEVFRDLREADFAQLARRSDIERVEATLKTDIERVEATLKTDIERVETTLKIDIERVETESKNGMARLDAKIDIKIAELKVDIIRWVFGIAIAQAALILAVLRLFPGAHP